jgi:hypothetical protein
MKQSINIDVLKLRSVEIVKDGVIEYCKRQSQHTYTLIYYSSIIIS